MKIIRADYRQRMNRLALAAFVLGLPFLVFAPLALVGLICFLFGGGWIGYPQALTALLYLAGLRVWWGYPRVASGGKTRKQERAFWKASVWLNLLWVPCALWLVADANGYRWSGSFEPGTLLFLAPLVFLAISSVAWRETVHEDARGVFHG